MKASTSTRRRIFRAIVLAPLAFVSVVALAALIRLVQIVTQDPLAVVEAFRPRLETTPVPDTATSTRAGAPGIERDGRWVRLDRQGSELLVHVHGGSTTVLPSDDVAFPGKLQAAFDPASVRIANLGNVGFTAAAMQVRASSALAQERPDLVIAYEGHNDTTDVYRRTLQEAYGFFERNPVCTWAAAPILWATLARAWNDPHRARERWPWVLKLELQPLVTRRLAEAGLVSANPEADRLAAEFARDQFLNSMRVLLEDAAKADVPVVLVTPISNLEYEPIGLGPQARDAWRAGLAETDRAKRLELLRRARDLDTFSGAIRAKSTLVEAIRRLDDGHRVHVLDLERALDADPSFAYGNADFTDELHFTPATHARVADHLLAFLRARGLLPTTSGEASTVP